MRSFIDLDRTLGSQPVRLGARLARLDVGRGREALYRDQLPEVLRAPADGTPGSPTPCGSATETSASAQATETPWTRSCELRRSNQSRCHTSSTFIANSSGTR